jgi:hypothetical protein
LVVVGGDSDSRVIDGEISDWTSERDRHKSIEFVSVSSDVRSSVFFQVVLWEGVDCISIIIVLIAVPGNIVLSEWRTWGEVNQVPESSIIAWLKETVGGANVPSSRGGGNIGSDMSIKNVEVSWFFREGNSTGTVTEWGSWFVNTDSTS